MLPPGLKLGVCCSVLSMTCLCGHLCSDEHYVHSIPHQQQAAFSVHTVHMFMSQGHGPVHCTWAHLPTAAPHRFDNPRHTYLLCMCDIITQRMPLTCAIQVAQPRARPVVLSGHTGEVTAVAWCNGNSNAVATCGDDASIRVWRVHRQWPPKPSQEKPALDWGGQVLILLPKS